MLNTAYTERLNATFRARLRPGGRLALLGTTMAPGFDPADFEAGEREPLLSAYPAFREMIVELSGER